MNLECRHNSNTVFTVANPSNEYIFDACDATKRFILKAMEEVYLSLA